MDTQELVKMAFGVREQAYVPYSGYRVGAAVESNNGNVFVGCNVENISFGATLCAERAALSAMVSAGDLHAAKLAVATADGGTPCGICLQWLAELGRNAVIYVASETGTVREYRLSELLPASFASEKVHRTER